MKKTKLTALLLTLTLLLTACFNNDEPDETEKTKKREKNTEAEEIDISNNVKPDDNPIDSLIDTYSSAYEYTDPIYNMERGNAFVFSGIKEEFSDTVYDDFAVYLDSDFKNDYFTDLTYDRENETVTIGPGYYPALDIYKEGGPDSSDWGNASKYWLVQYRDYTTGKLRDKPLVTLFTVKNELNAPTVKFGVDAKGYAVFEWDEVEGADNYSVYRLDVSDEYGIALADLYLSGETKDASFKEFENYRMTDSYDGSVILTNYDFYEYEDSGYRTAFCVIASGAKGKSSVSNFVYVDENNSRLPYSQNYSFMGGDNQETDSFWFNSAKSLPSHAYVEMCNGKIAPQLLDYKNAAYEKREFSSLLNINVGIIGTDFTCTVQLDLDDWNADAEAEYKNNLDFLTRRQEDMSSNASAVAPKDNIKYTPPVDATFEENTDPAVLDENIKAVESVQDKVNSGEIKIYANTALGAYIAMNMLNGVEKIDVSPFKEAYDMEYLSNALCEAYRQNPLIGSVSGFGYDYRTNSLVVEYDFTPDEIKSMQDEIIPEVKRVVSQIIKPGMSELEKEIAINAYLCDSAEYDMDALENAEENDFDFVDKEYLASFTPYGVLINKIGVCASYAGAFKLLADEAGLETVVVIGYLNGNLPHAWNRVRIGDQWMSVDSTNNDSLAKNALFNIPDRISSGVLVEDDDYLYKPVLAQMSGTAEDLEMYHLQGNYYELDDLGGAISERLKSGVTFAVRTDYSASETDIGDIVVNEARKAGVLNDIDDCRVWLGVVVVFFE